MKSRGFAILLTAIFLSITAFSSSMATENAWQFKVHPAVFETFQKQEETEYFVVLTQQADLSGAGLLSTKDEKGAFVYQTLTQTALDSQGPLLAYLNRIGVPNQPFWIVNMIWVRGDSQLLEWLPRRSDVVRVDPNPQIRLDAPVTSAQPKGPAAVDGIEWNITHVNAPLFWAAGFTGQGVVIGGQDTGYDWYHPGLKESYRGWDGDSASHDYNWHDAIHSGVGECGADSPEPCDVHGHGTHTMGTMVGSEGVLNQVGMAPGAEWIACRNMNNAGDGTPLTYTECYEWFIAPYPNGDNKFTQGDATKAPDVINNSWSCPTSEGCVANSLEIIVNAVKAAGIVTVHSAGNSGSGCETINAPAGIYDASFTVAATDYQDVVASFSSRGPVAVDGSDRLKPDISAPGVSIRSTHSGGGYSSKSGTSMAAPHVVGLVALLISADPSLAGQVDTIEQIISQTALPLTTSQGCGGDTPTSVPNHVYGYGRIDAWAGFIALLPEKAFLPLIKQ